MRSDPDSFTHPSDSRVLIVEVIEKYGRVTIYPRCELSHKFAALLGQKTLTETDVQKIKELGYTIKTKEVIL